MSAKRTFENKVKRDFGMDFVKFMAQCRTENIPVGKVAEMIHCSLSNLHRIIRKHGVDYAQQHPAELMLATDLMFQNKKMNMVNCLSRKWVA